MKIAFMFKMITGLLKVPGILQQLSV